MPQKLMVSHWNLEHRKGSKTWIQVAMTTNPRKPSKWPKRARGFQPGTPICHIVPVSRADPPPQNKRKSPPPPPKNKQRKDKVLVGKRWHTLDLRNRWPSTGVKRSLPRKLGKKVWEGVPGASRPGVEKTRKRVEKKTLNRPICAPTLGQSLNLGSHFGPEKNI